MNRRALAIGAAALLALAGMAGFAGAADNAGAKPGAKAPAADASTLARGRYLVQVGSCNDCHTDGFAESGGKLPEKDWLLGGKEVGFKGPWGTTYAPNLRLSLSRMTEVQWVRFARELKTRPPMPWYSVNTLGEADARALYRYVRSLGPVGQPAPDYVPPDKEPPSPYLLWPGTPKK